MYMHKFCIFNFVFFHAILFGLVPKRHLGRIAVECGIYFYRKNFKFKKRERIFPKVSAATVVSPKVVKSEAVSTM